MSKYQKFATMIIVVGSIVSNSHAGGFAGAVSAAFDKVGTSAVNAASDTASGVLSKHRTEGGNILRGSLDINTKVRIGGSITSENYSEALVGAVRMVKTEVGGNTTIKTDVQVGRDVVAKNASTVVLGSVDSKNSKVGGNLQADMRLRVGGSVVAENGSYINAASLRLNGTQIGGNLTFKSDVQIGRDLTAKNLSTLIVGGVDL